MGGTKMKHTLIILLLLISIVSLSHAQGHGINKAKIDPGPIRKTGCSNPNFIAAELKAYHTLIEARAEAERILADSITDIEHRKKIELGQINLNYLQALNKCGNNAHCTEAAKVNNDSLVSSALVFYDEAIIKVQAEAYDSKEEAQKKYDEEVKEAIKLYCHSYTAAGKNGPVVYSGTICSLDKPFTITGTISSGPIVYPFKFIPSSDTAGTFSFITTFGPAKLEGGGTYIIEGSDTGKPRILLKTSSTGTLAGRTTSGSGPAEIDLVLLGTGCDGQ
jgi:hypothetical protein